MQKPTLSSFSLSALVPLWAFSALALRGVAPWLFWSTMVALPAAVLLLNEWKFLSSKRGRQILGICAALFVLHIGWAIVRAQFYDPSQHNTYWQDDYRYYDEAAAIAAAWAEGNYPEFWRKGDSPYLGTLHTGYHRPLSLLFLLSGPSTFAGLLLNAVCAALFPLLTAMAGRYLWTDFTADAATPPSQYLKDPVLVTAVMTAAHPMQFYWSSYIMKDVYVAFVFLVSLVLLLGAWKRRSPTYTVASVFLLPYLFTVRMYTALSLVLGAICLPVLRMKTRPIIYTAAASLAVLFLIVSYTFTGNRLYEQMRDSFVALAPSGVSSPLVMFRQMIAGIPRLFLAPYAWLILPEPTPMYGMYPGMWYLYLVGYPLGFAGFYAALKRDIHLSIVPIAAFGVASILFLTAAYGGNASRQRFYLEYVVLIFAGYGLVVPNKWWIIGILLAETAFAVGQVIALR